jgi:WD40 repeat protein
LRGSIGDRTADPPFLLITRDAVWFNPTSDHHLDVAELFAVRDRSPEAWEQIAAAYRGEFLQGFSVADSDPFEEWLRSQREECRRRMTDLFRRLADFRETQGDLNRAMEYARRQLELEGWLEDGHRRLMRLLALSGQRDQALVQFEACRRSLMSELGIAPSPETVALHDQIRDNVLARPNGTADLDKPADQPAQGYPPFKGLSWFEETDAALFCGREELTTTLVSEVRDFLTGADSRAQMLTIVGASGSGKSSIVRAGLIPALRELQVPTWGSFPPFQDSVVLLTPTSAPLVSLAANLAQMSESAPTVGQLVDSLSAGPQALHEVATRITADPEAPACLLLVVDQFEELFTLCRDEAGRRAFIDNLVYAATTSGPVMVVIVLRADFYAACAPYERLRQVLTDRQVYIGAMSLDELRRAMEEPAHRGNWFFEPGLTDLMLHDVSHAPGALPLLSHALLATWQRREGRTLTLAGYQSSGGIDGALAQSAETLYARFSLAEKVLARRIFLRLTEVVDAGEDGPPAYYIRRAPLSELIGKPEESAQAQRILSYLADARLVIIGHDSAEMAHEALIHAWPRLSDWLNENRNEIRLHHRLAVAAQEWQRSGCDEGLLLRGAQLEHARDLAAGRPHDLNDLEHDYLAAAVQREQARQQQQMAIARQIAEMEQTRAAEQAHAATELRRRSHFLAVASLAAVLLALVAVGFAHIARRNARQALDSESAALVAAAAAAQLEAEALVNADLATSRMLAVQATNAIDTDPELSVLLALEALERAETREAGESLHLALQSLRVRRAFATGATGGNLVLMALSPDGAHLATVGESEAVIWSTETGEPLHRFPLSDRLSLAYDLDFNTAGDALALAAANEGTGEIKVQSWDVATGTTAVHTLPIELTGLTDLSLGHDWQSVAVSRADGETMLLGVGDEVAIALDDHDGRVVDVEFSPGGDRLATASRDGTVIIWDVPETRSVGTGQVLAALESEARLAETGNLVKILFLDDASLALGFLGSVEVWDLADTTQPRLSLRGQTGLIKNLAVSPDQSRLATTGQDGITSVWDLSRGDPLLSLASHYAPVDSAAFSPDGMEVVTMDRYGLAKVWDARSLLLGERGTFQVDRGTFDAELSPDGQSLALGNVAGPASIWDTSSGRRLFTLPSGAGPVYRVAYSPDGRRLATVGQDNQIRIWDPATGEQLLAFSGHGAGAAGGLFAGTLDAAFSPDGRSLVTAGADGQAIIWDPATGRKLRTLAGHTGAVQSVVYSPDGTLIATSTDQNDTTVKVWTARSGDVIYTLAGHPAHVWGLAFSPDSKLLVSGGARGVIKVWDMATGQEVYQRVDKSDDVGSIAFTPDGDYFLTTGAVPLRIWRSTDGEEILTLAGPMIWAIDISSDGRWVFAADIDGVVRVLALNLADAIPLAHERLTRWWRPDECLRYLGSAECPPAPADLLPTR